MCDLYHFVHQEYFQQAKGVKRDQQFFNLYQESITDNLVKHLGSSYQTTATNQNKAE